ncbi:MAG TPA: hypothetical protein EYG92_04880 [Lutibacter sp.]|nr:hypothetical protein [Lutibacter sp.]
MFLYSFEKLEVWKESIKLVKSIYKITKLLRSAEAKQTTKQINHITYNIS